MSLLVPVQSGILAQDVEVHSTLSQPPVPSLAQLYSKRRPFPHDPEPIENVVSACPVGHRTVAPPARLTRSGYLARPFAAAVPPFGP